MSNFIPGFERIKNLYLSCGFSAWHDKFQKLKNNATPENRHQLERALKSIFEEICRHLSETQNSFGWQAMEELISYISKFLPEMKEEMDRIHLIEEHFQKREALKNILLDNRLLSFVAQQLSQVLHIQKKQTVGSITKNLLEHAKKLNEIAVNQNNYTPEGRLCQQLFDFLFFFIDLFCLKLGLPISHRTEAAREQQSIMPLKI